MKRLLGIKWWQYLIAIVLGLGFLGNFVPESGSPQSSSETTSPAWLLLAVPAIFMVVSINRIQKRRREERQASSVTPEKIRAEIAELQEAFEFFANHEAQHNETEPDGIVARRNEHVIADVSEVGLVESRRGPTQFSGDSTGVSFRLTKRLSVRQSGMKGKATPGKDVPTLIDTGRFIVTDERAMFVGGLQSREFEWDKLLAFSIQNLDRKSAMLFLPVSNRQKVSGIAADLDSIEKIHQRVAFGVSVA
ncbi:MAG: hypothetical protein EBU84_20450, partial [Actinobacteria bacterium]|nr:hypothetical protein [Actinomycetota bacterium]